MGGQRKYPFNPETFGESFWNWDFINEVCDGSIRVSDVDGIIERKGFFFIFETKGKYAGQPLGQKIMYERLVKTGLFSVMYIWGDRNEPEAIEILFPEVWGQPSQCKTTGRMKADEAKIQGWVKRWFKRINEGGKA